VIEIMIDSLAKRTLLSMKNLILFPNEIVPMTWSADVQRKQNTQKEFHQTKNQKNT